MKLELRDNWCKTDFRCDLTRRLDEISQINQSPYYDFYHHYIVIDKIPKTAVGKVDYKQLVSIYESEK